MHTTEGIKRVGDLVAFFNRANATGSSHAGADNTGALWGPERGYVPYDRAAWTLRNGNPVSDNLEYCGWAKTTRPQWTIEEAKGLDAIARWLAERSRARGIPLVKLTPAEVKAGKSGVIGHADWTTGMNDGTHWDPGPGFPWDVVIDKARAYAAGQTVEDDMFTDQDRQIMGEIRAQLTGSSKPNEYPGLPADLVTNGKPRTVVQALGDLANGMRSIYDTLTPGKTGVKLNGDVWAKVTDTHARVAGLEAAVRALAEARGGDLDVDALVSRVDTAVRDAMTDTVRVEVTVPDQP